MAGSTSPEWSEERLRGLLGEAESLRLEFKSNRLFEKSVDDWKADLAKEISAFANSEGGTMVSASRRIVAPLDGRNALRASW
jgi:hypothetical protein